MSLFKDRVELEIQEAELATQKALAGFPPVIKWLLIFCVLAIIPAYLISKTVAQKVWLGRYQQNALAAKPSFTNPKTPTVSPVSVTSLGSGVYAAVVQVSNQNLDLSADNVPYQFSFYNSQKQQIYSESGQLFLLPNQTKYVVLPRFTAPEPVAYSDFQFSGNIPWQKRLSIPTVNLTTSLPSSSQQASPPAFVVQGSFTNQSPYTLAQVELTFVLFDNNNNIIGTSERDEFTVAPFELRSYKQLWPNIFATNLGSIEVFADTDSLDPNNVSYQPPPASSASDLSRPTPTNQ